MLKITRNVVKLLFEIVVAYIPSRTVAQGPFFMDTTQLHWKCPCLALRNLRHPKDEELVCDRSSLRTGSWKQF